MIDVCVGLDPSRYPIDDVFQFNKRIVDETYDLVGAYKLNLAFYEALGIDGLRGLEKTIGYIRDVSPNAMIIGDGKRGDVGVSAIAYAKAMFEVWGFDATTVQIYQGTDSLAPFLSYKYNTSFVCCQTSNPSSVQLQDTYLVNKVAELAVKSGSNVGLVVGAVFLDQMARLRKSYPDTLFLVPGVGAQGGSASDVVRVVKDNALISSSRGVIYSPSPRDAVKDLISELEYGKM